MGSGAVPALYLTCQDCKVLKPEDQFHRHSGKINGRRSACKDCSNAAHRLRNARRPAGQSPGVVASPRSSGPHALWSTPAINGQLPCVWGSDLVYHEGKLYSCGGYGQEKAGLMMVDTATWQAGSVDSFGEPPASHDSHSVTSYGNTMLVFGGIDSSSSSKHDSVHVCELRTRQWRQLAMGEGPAPAAREGHSAVLDPARQQLLVFGGNSMDADADAEGLAAQDITYLNDLWALRLDSSTWCRLERSVTARAPMQRDSHSAVLLGSRMIVFGGDRGGGQYLSDLWSYDVHCDEWEQLQVRSPSSPAPRAGHAAGVIRGTTGSGDSMLLFGGVGGAGDSYFNDVWLLHVGPDPGRRLARDEACWSRVPTSGREPSGRFAQAAVVEGNRLFIVGGCNAEAQPLSDVHVLTVTVPPLLPAPAASFPPVSLPGAPGRYHPTSWTPGTTPSGKAEGAVAEEAMATRRARRGPGQWTSFHIFCEQLRGPLRESFPLITTALWRECEAQSLGECTPDGESWHASSGSATPSTTANVSRDLERRMSGQWADISEADKRQCALEADARNQAGRRPSAVEVSAADPQAARKRQFTPEQTHAKKRQRDQNGQFVPRSDAVGAAVSGIVNGSFDCGLLATVTVNGQCFRAVLFNTQLPALGALDPPQGTAVLESPWNGHDGEEAAEATDAPQYNGLTSADAGAAAELLNFRSEEVSTRVKDE